MSPTPARRGSRHPPGRPHGRAAPPAPPPAMVVSLDLLVNAIVAGVLLGGFYAAVSGRHHDLVRHARHRQYRPAGLHPARLPTPLT